MRFYSIILFLSLSFYSHSQFIKRLDSKKQSSLELTQRIQQLVDSSKITGLQCVILNNNQLVYQHSFGFKDSRTKLLNTNETIFYGASFTKPIAAAVFLKLVDEKVFSLCTYPML